MRQAQRLLVLACHQATPNVGLPLWRRQAIRVLDVKIGTVTRFRADTVDDHGNTEDSGDLESRAAEHGVVAGDVHLAEGRGSLFRAQEPDTLDHVDVALFLVPSSPVAALAVPGAIGLGLAAATALKGRFVRSGLTPAVRAFGAVEAILYYCG
ncbi:hypothetical protein LTR42_009568 [Elasticomyces elasticus]|nr:hypothetical protein LTR42_009568 [Elasticomyces elasticus]